MSYVNPIVLLQAEVEGRSLRAIADQVGCSPQHIHAVLKGRKRPGPAVLRFLGLEKSLEYKRSDKQS